MFVSWMISVLCLVSLSLEEASNNMNPNYYCADLNPQTHVDIEQLMGVWYVIEIISHSQEERQAVDDLDTCPVVYISEDSSFTTLRPLDKNFFPGQIYGDGFGTSYSESYGYDNNYYTEPPGTRKHNRPRYGTKVKQPRRLKIRWEEEASHIEFTVSYTSKHSVWFSSGPHNGSSLPHQLDHFAGVIQVIKAVGDHLVLTFCYRLPEPKLYTTLMSRLHILDQVDINGIHNMLTRKDLDLSAIRKTCGHNGSSKYDGRSCSLVMLVLVVTFKIFGC